MSIVASKKKSGKNNRHKTLEQCQVPGCSHAGLMITKVHYRMAHDIERDEAIKLYGEVRSVSLDQTAIKKNLAGHTPVYGLVNSSYGKRGNYRANHPTKDSR